MKNQHNIPFIYYNDFAKVVVGNKIYHFGNIQAKVIKQLYIAASTDSPWVFGKQALYKAGSSTVRMSGLFGSKLKSQKIVVVFLKMVMIMAQMCLLIIAG
ncbi:MAG: hypothetical protein HRU35_03240 [Rickettsiaceae bacterium]|nr:hypothetical protein [Rickettsiaceae bacterium]